MSLSRNFTPRGSEPRARTQSGGHHLFLPWMAVVDAFQHWIYTQCGHTAVRSARAAYLETDETDVLAGPWTGRAGRRFA